MKKQKGITWRAAMKWVFFWFAQQVTALLFHIFGVIGWCTGGRFFYRMKITGKENLRPLRRPVILIANHKTFTDHFYLAAALFFNFKIMPMRAMAADWIYRVPARKCGFLFRWFMNMLGAFPEAGGIGLRTALRTIEAGQSVLVYPEGFVFRERGMLPLQKGVVWLAKKTGVQFLPVGLRGLEHSTPKGFFFGGRTVTIAFGAPFRIGAREDTNAALAMIKKKLEDLYYEQA